MTRRLLVISLAAAISGCVPVPEWIRIVTPADGEERTWMPVTLVIDFDASAPLGSLVVLLNGNDVTGDFEVVFSAAGRTAVAAEHVWDGLVLPGSNTLDASIDGPGGRASVVHTFESLGDPYADEVVAFAPGTGAGFGQTGLPGIVLGPPAGFGLFAGSEDVLSLGLSGRIDLRFVDNAVVDGPGPDFTVFENSFLGIGVGLFTDPPFSEPGRVSVSQDGSTWFAFPCNLSPGESPYYPGCAGVYPVLSDGTAATPHASIPTPGPPIEDLVGVSILGLETPAGAGGDGFDLADVGLAWARYVRIDAAPFLEGPPAETKAGFDLDALAAVYSVPATDANENGIPDAVE